MKRILGALFALLGAVGIAQGQAVQQSGNVTPGHAARWVTNGVIGDAGTAANGSLTSLGVTFNGKGICQNSGAITGAYNQVCLGVTPTGGTISLYNYSGATGGLTLNINGTTQGFGTVSLPVTIGDIACFSNSAGNLVDCAFSPTTLPTLAAKPPVQLATTANVTLSGEQTIDGVVTSASRVLVWKQTNLVQNGIYVTSSGAWARAADFSVAGQVVQGTQIYVTQGTQAGFTFAVVSPSVVTPAHRA